MVIAMRKNAHCPRAEVNASLCNCSVAGCTRHGLCCECLHFHRERGELPGCYFSEKEERTYNRSIEFYVQRRFR